MRASWRLLLCGLAATTMVVTACGGDDETPAPVTPEEDASAETDAAADDDATPADDDATVVADCDPACGEGETCVDGTCEADAPAGFCESYVATC
ncbi:MAG: hypothetical protein VX938_11505, partial [Myxococcota bacterium]|nr:hypothetical protein [Myxococcota bacterium]